MAGSTIVVAVITIQWVMLAVGAVAGGGGGGELIDPIWSLELSAEAAATGVDSLSTDVLTLDDRMLEWVNDRIYESDQAGGRLLKYTLRGRDGTWISYEAEANQTYYGGPGSHEKLLDEVSKFRRPHPRF